MLAWERQRRLQDKYNYIQELDRVANFSWEDWRKRVRLVAKLVTAMGYEITQPYLLPFRPKLYYKE